jgi:hypothetical protein
MPRVFPAPDDGQVFNTDYVGKSTRGVNLGDCTNPTNPNAFTFVQDPATGAPVRKVARFEINTTDTKLSGNYRSEVKLTAASQLYTFDDQGWTYRFSFLLPTGFVQDADIAEDVLFQVHNTPDGSDYTHQSPPFAIVTHGANLQINGRYAPADETTQNGQIYTVNLGPWVTDHWYDFVLFVQWSAFFGNLYLYQDGQLVYSRLNTSNAYSDAVGGYAKQGNYKYIWGDSPGVSTQTQRITYCDKLQVHNKDTRYLSNLFTAGMLDMFAENGATPPTCYGLRKLHSAYAGKAVTVRRSSDNTTTDIGFTQSGDLDTVALLAFVGANSGFISKWYDQSGNGFHAVQATTGNQPRIVNAGTIETVSGKPGIRFIAASSTFLSLSSGLDLTNGTSDASLMAVANVISNASTPTLISILNNSTNARATMTKTAADKLSSGGRTLDADSLVSITSTPSIAGAAHVLSSKFEFSNGLVSEFIDGVGAPSGQVFHTAGNASATNSSAILIGASSAAGANPLDGVLGEVILYGSLIFDADRKRIEYLQGKYYTIGVTP